MRTPTRQRTTPRAAAISMPLASPVSSTGFVAFAMAAALLVAGRTASADDALACWGRSMELVDQTINPPEGGDVAFFTRVGGGPPAAMMVFANTPGMMHLPGFRPEETPLAQRGCAANEFLNTRTWTARSPLHPWNSSTAAATNCNNVVDTPAQNGKAYDKSFVYPRIDDGCYMGKSYKTADDFRPDSFYRYLQWGDSGVGSHRSATQACDDMPTIGLWGNERTACQQCLNDGEPYYISRSDPSQMAVRGNFLHFYGPSYLGALAAWKATIAGNAKIRWGHGLYDNNLPGIAKGRDPNPECNKFDSDFNPSNRGSYINSFSNGPPPFASISKWPLAQALFQIGYFLTDSNRFSNASSYARTGNNQWSSKQGQNQDPICAPCQFSATIVITDGAVNNEPASSIHPDIRAMNIDTPGKDASKLGNLCSPSVPFSCGTSLQCLPGALGIHTCQDAFYADDVAAYFANNDLRNGKCGPHHSNPAPGQTCDPEVQTMSTYVINVGAPGNAALRNVARVGNGLYIEAATAAEIASAMHTIVNDIIRRSTSFSVASVSSVQTRTLTSVFVPRFKPSVMSTWEGHLFRYSLFNEYAAGCRDGVDTVPPFTPEKKARNPNLNGSCGDVYVVDADGDFVGENEDGDFVKLDDDTEYPWSPTTTPAKHFWDLAETLVTNGPDARNIQTAVDQDGDGVVQPDEQIAFTVENRDKLIGALGLGAVDGPYCSAFGERLGLTLSTLEECAEILIRWVRGEDVFDEDADGNTTESRELMLQDIFHSSPNLVVPPLSPILVDLGAKQDQSVASLFKSPTPQGYEAYNGWRDEWKDRDQFVLVGSNAGMLHAVHAGAWVAESEEGEEKTLAHFDEGTGRELWAFIPPEMLPKLKRLLTGEGHQEMVDGSPMVRDIWHDANHDGVKQADEFLTLAVTHMRRGGRSRFALDITDPTDPKFLWQVFGPGSKESLEAGESWGDAAPLPPAIVPVAAEVKSPYQETFRVRETPAREQWVVLFGGGYDPMGIRGRSIHAVDAFTGQPVFRFSAGNVTTSGDPRRSLGPVAAAVGAVDWEEYSQNEQPDGLFDMANVGDVWGNMWTLRMAEPGVDTDGDGLYDNWHAGRAFETHRGEKFANRMPFFEIPQHAITRSTPAQLRVYTGSGDRAFIRDQKGGVCRLNNISGCVRKGCSVDVNMVRQDVGGATSSGRFAVGSSSTSPTTYTLTSASGSSACDAASDVSVTATLNCGAAGTGIYSYGLQCPDGDLPCTSISPRPVDQQIDFAGTTATNRFFSMRVFAPPVRPQFTTALEAATYDAARLSEDDLNEPDKGEFSSYDDDGWFVTYAHQDERTSGAPFIAGQGVYWQSLTPLSETTGCSRTGTDTGSTYQAQLVTGGTSVVTGTNAEDATAIPRRTSRTVLTPPKTLIPQKVITPSGEVITVGLGIDAGDSPFAVEGGRTELYTPIQVLEVDQRTHNCRHRDPPICP